jgi:hypothetical protein
VRRGLIDCDFDDYAFDTEQDWSEEEDLNRHL